MNDIESKLVTAMNGIVGIQQYMVGLPERKTYAQQILENKSFQGLKSGKGDIATIELKTAITSTGAINDPLVPSGTPPIDPGKRRTLSVRDLIPAFPTMNGAIEMPVASTKTNNATGVQAGSPVLRENVTLPESAYTFTTSFTPVETIAHLIPFSAQVSEDAGTLDGFINTELLYGLELGIENQIVNGPGTTGLLDGLLNNATAYTLRSPNLTGEADIIRDAIRQVNSQDFKANAILLNPDDWYDLDVSKAGASDDAYTAGQPRLMDGPKLWGLPVVETNTIASGTFLVADFNRAAILFERTPVSLEISRMDSSNFQTGMLTAKAQQRMALVVTNALALCTGSL